MVEVITKSIIDGALVILLGLGLVCVVLIILAFLYWVLLTLADLTWKVLTKIYDPK